MIAIITVVAYQVVFVIILIVTVPAAVVIVIAVLTDIKPFLRISPQTI
jgi:hypothetical protein